MTGPATTPGTKRNRKTQLTTDARWTRWAWLTALTSAVLANYLLIFTPAPATLALCLTGTGLLLGGAAHHAWRRRQHAALLRRLTTLEAAHEQLVTDVREAFTAVTEATAPWLPGSEAGHAVRSGAPPVPAHRRPIHG